MHTFCVRQLPCHKFWEINKQHSLSGLYLQMVFLRCNLCCKRPTWDLKIMVTIGAGRQLRFECVVGGNYTFYTDGLKIQTLTEQSQYDETVNRPQALRGHSTVSQNQTWGRRSTQCVACHSLALFRTIISCFELHIA